jgi:chemotaxis protein methyltransferase CheR
MKNNHPPVVMISSVAREDADLAFKCLEAGATDYVEKPALSNLLERSDEIRIKLKYALELSKQKKDLDLERAFAKTPGIISDPEKKLRLILATLSDRSRIDDFLRGLPKGQPPTFILIEGAGSGLSALKSSLKKLSGGPEVEWCENLAAQEIKINTVYLSEAQPFFKHFKAISFGAISVVVFSQISKHLAKFVRDWAPGQVLLEDKAGHKQHELHDLATDIIPATGFAYHSNDFLTGKKR